MNKRIVGMLAAAALLAAALPASAQTQPRVSGSDSSSRSGPTCLIAGIASDCAGSAVTGPISPLPVPVVVGALPVVGPILGVVVGGQEGGRVGSDTDVDRNTRQGVAVAR
jgi:hypothetical protein